MACLRRLVAGALLLGAICFVTVSNLQGKWRVCEETSTTTEGKISTTKKCRPIVVTDAPIVLLTILMTALVAPDLAKIKIAGLLEVERKIDEQKATVAEISHKIDILSVKAEASASSGVFMGPHFWVSPDRTWPPGRPINMDKNKLAEKAREFTSGEGSEHAE